MALDASIYGRFQPRSAVSYATEFEQLGAMRDQRQDNALARSFRQEQMGAARAQAGRADALRQLQQSLAGKPEDEYVQGLRGAGYFDEAAAAEAGMLERRGKAADVKKKGADAAKTFGEAQAGALNRYRQALDLVDTPEGAARWIQAQYQDPLLADTMTATLGPMEQSIARLPTDPAQFQQWRQQAALGMERWLKQKMDEAAANKPPSPPAAIAEYEYAKRQGYQGTFEQWVTSKARAGAATTSVNYSQPVEAVDAQGNRVFIRTTKDSMEPAIVPGVRPPMSAAEERSASERSSRERQARQMVSGLEDARAILDAGRATQSGVGNLIDAAARLVGQTTVGAQDAARLEALSGWLVANVPRMEGPQSNFDVQNYTTMAGKIGDRTVPREERKAALKEVERLQRKYAEINGTPMPAPAAPAAPASGGWSIRPLGGK